MEVTTEFPPALMFNAFVSEDKFHIHNFDVSEIILSIQNVEFIEGDGGAGSIKKITFKEGSEVKYVKQKIEAIDEENFSVNYIIIEGEALMNNLEKISYDIKFIAASDGGSICNISSSKHYTFGDIYIKEEDIKAEKKRALGLIKALEAYLMANRKAPKIKLD
ncbi:hypothetical protein SLEP1_g57104 [Rubroshorea leprosula]|uniref:Bet v I/Major latex protein domain-containing protein n=1 Tax=Rubroshorea leprosula TaxID=152421 RepID=A0AAV5MLU1_9ROSI|nr:hypothetical protein SLEP1_g57104 [Rubroshorea leprosula]